MKKSLFFLLIILFFPLVINAYTVANFKATAVFSGTSASQIESLENLVGVSGYIIEDFEDDTLITGLTISSDGVFNSSSPNRAFTNATYPNTEWDGIRTICPSITDYDVIFHYATGTISFGIGIGDIESDMRLIVNGEDKGLVRSLPNWERPGDNTRDVYIRIDLEAGDSPITEVKFTKTGVSDGIFFDHLAISPVAAFGVPEPSSFIFVLIMGLALYFYKK